jgi:hypothetical protein
MSAEYITFRTGRSPKALATTDDTIHAVTEFSRLIERGVPKREAVLPSYLRAFPAVVFTTVIPLTDLPVLRFSKLAPIRNPGAVTSGVMDLVCRQTSYCCRLLSARRTGNRLEPGASL